MNNQTNHKEKNIFVCIAYNISVVKICLKIIENTVQLLIENNL